MVTTSRPDAASVFSDLAPLWSEGSDGLADRVVRALRAGGAVLDIGCGPGGLLAEVREEAARRGRRTGVLAGVDVATGMVREAGRRPGVLAVPGDTRHLPFRDHLFDVVVASHVLHFVDDPVRAVREMLRVVQPGGTLVVSYFVRSGRAERLPFDRRTLPAGSLLRRYLEVPRRFQASAFRRALETAGCRLQDVRLPARGTGSRAAFLARVARASGTPEDLRAARLLETQGVPPDPSFERRLLVARAPGPRTGRMPVEVVGLEGWTAGRVRALLADLPVARGYRVVVKPLRYRTRPHVQAFCEFEDKRIIVQVPVPFRPFHEDVPYRARRVSAKGLRFKWFTKRLRFDRPDELIRYLYLHEYYHWYLRECLGKPSAAETACDRFALQRL